MHIYAWTVKTQSPMSRANKCVTICLLVRLRLAKIFKEKCIKKRIIISLLCTSLAHAEEGSREDTSVESYIFVQFVSWLFGSGTFKLRLHRGACMDECADYNLCCVCVLVVKILCRKKKKQGHTQNSGTALLSQPATD